MFKTISTTLANSLWYLSSLPEWYAFHRANLNVAQTQREVLRHLLDRNAETEIGRHYNFATLNSVTQYQKQVPLSTYDDYRIAIANISVGQPGVLTNDSMLMLELTNGVTAPTRYIPYTAKLKSEFQQALATWIVDLFTYHPYLLTGCAYWSMTSVAHRQPFTIGGIPIGFEEDSEYLSDWQRYLLHTVMAVPPVVRLIEDIESFRYVTLLFLLRSRHLTMMSVWHPTFLTLLMERLYLWWPRLVTDLRQGTVTPTHPLPPNLYPLLMALNPPDYQRAAEIHKIFTTQQPPGIIHHLLWPKLQLISCWADTQTKSVFNHLKLLFPKTRIQGKGLIATEGFISFPLFRKTGAALAMRSHFFEFLPIEEGPIRLAHQLDLNARYEVVITTGGGLYRYQLHDIVQVVGKVKECPLLHFLGKAAHISDWFGEKLTEQSVREIVNKRLAHYALNPTFVMVACDEWASEYAYTLFIEIEEMLSGILKLLAKDLELALQENFHYRYCRELKQLGHLRIFRIEKGGLETYLKVGVARGQRAGDIKLSTLHQAGGWSQIFRGKHISW